MSLATSEILKNSGNLMLALGEAVKTTSDGGKQITKSEWVSAGKDFAAFMGMDFLDDDEE